jgi:NADH-quinone oxidoreductase subunit L
MDTGILLSWLLGLAVLTPLASFLLIFLAGPLMGKHGKQAGLCATFAILISCALSFAALATWLGTHPPTLAAHGAHHDDAHHDDAHHDDAHHDDHGSGDDHSHGADASRVATATRTVADEAGDSNAAEHGHDEHGHGHDEYSTGPFYSYEVYRLGEFLGSAVSISVYVDALTVAMFAMVTLIASCIHFYAMGYMHDELTDKYVDHEVTMADGSHLHRSGRFHRFFQALSLFCFSMLGLVIAGNIAMTFVFWELVGICSYFLIGFYVERKSASTAANKAFIVNRVGDFGMIIGLMVIWSTMGTFSFESLFAMARPGETHALIVPDGMVVAAASEQVEAVVLALGPEASQEQIDAAIAERVPEWRAAMEPGEPGRAARWLLIIAGVGIFCGCVGKSAQFPLHVWLPDAMEGPTPVSALVHSATMVAAGVFLVARFFPFFAPEVLLVIALTGTITLFIAATIAITATDIKRVLAYSTVSQLGYMMLALGVGGWLAGVMHLFTHAFFKSLLFMCSGSVIHAVHTNEMPEMGGLRKKMPWTAYTMLVGCLAIAGAGIPFVIGFSGYYSKDAILEQALSFRHANPGWGTFFFVAAAGGAAITAFYMFRLWYMTFAGEPRNQERYDHAHESPPVMYRPLIVLATLAVAAAWGPQQAILGGLIALLIFAVLKFMPQASESGEHAAHAHASPAHQDAGQSHSHGAHKHDGHGSDPHDHGHNAHDHGLDGHGHDDDGHHGHHVGWKPLHVALGISAAVVALGVLWLPLPNITLGNVLEQARPAGTLPTETAALNAMVWPNEHDSHAPAIKVPATMIAFSTAFAGFLLATVFYGLRKLDPAESQRTFAPIHRFLVNKWWFDELFAFVFVKPAHLISSWISQFDRKVIDGLIDGSAWTVRMFSNFWDRFADRTIVDGFVNWIGNATYNTGLSLRRAQTGSLRQYVMFIVVGTVVIVVIASFWRHAMAY